MRQLHTKHEELHLITEQDEGENNTRAEELTNQAAKTEKKYYDKGRSKAICQNNSSSEINKNLIHKNDITV